MEQQFSEVAFRLGCLVARVHGPIGLPRYGNLGIRRGTLNLLMPPTCWSMNWRNWVGLSP